MTTVPEYYHFSAVYQRNHAHSPHDPVMNYPIMARNLREFMQSQRLSSAYLLGHSLSGKTNLTTRVRFSRISRANYSQVDSISQISSVVT